jgi:type IV secretory pathway VirB10-like protein
METNQTSTAAPVPPTPPSGPIDKKKIGIGITVLIVGIITVAEFSANNNSTPAPALHQPKPGVGPTKATTPAAIGDFERQTAEEAQELARIQTQKDALSQALANAQAGAASPQPSNNVTLDALERQKQLAAATNYRQPSAGAASGDQLAEERKRRAYDSLYASSVALDLRSGSKAPRNETAGSERVNEDHAAAAQTPADAPASPQAGATATARNAAKANPYDFDSLTGKSYRLFEGEILETVLTNRLNGAFAGPVNCMVTTDVYSHDHQTLLIPQGARILGKVRAVANGQQQRLFVAFRRILMPDGYSISLDQFTGMNDIGETGLRDLVNHHYLQVFGASLALAAIGGVAQIGNGYSGFAYDPMTQIRNGISQSMAESSQRILDHFLNQLPTFIVRERTRVKIYLSDDLLLPAYGNHTMPRDL